MKPQFSSPEYSQHELDKMSKEAQSYIESKGLTVDQCQDNIMLMMTGRIYEIYPVIVWRQAEVMGKCMAIGALDDTSLVMGVES